MKVNTCGCGCGGVIEAKRWHKYNGVPKFLPGHSSRVVPMPRRYEPRPEEIPSGLCECGCGERTSLAKATYKDKRHFKGYPLPFLPRHHAPFPKGADSWKWKGGRIRTKAGYILRHAPDHPNRDRDGYVWEHRLVMEETLGRLLEKTEQVHHINGVKDDNRPENLIALTHAEHRAAHAGQPHKMTVESRKRIVEGGKKGAASRWKKP